MADIMNVSHAPKILSFDTDMESGEAFYERFKEDLLWSPELKQWHIRHNGVFRAAAEEYVRAVFMRWVKELIKAGYDTVGRLMKTGGMSSTLTVARTLFARPNVNFDSDKTLVGCQNGIIDLESGCLLTDVGTSIITKRIGCSFEPGAKCPMFEQFLNEIMCDNQEDVCYLKKLIGYFLSGDVSEQCFYIFEGNGSNGKSTFTGVLGELFGEYAGTIPVHALMREGSVSDRTCDIAMLQGKRFVSAAEPERGKHLAEARLKLLTGSDQVSARLLHKNPVLFTPTFKLCILSNGLPLISGTDEGIWRRVRVLAFDSHFDNQTKDKSLGEKLRGELPGILNLALEGYALLRAEGGLGSTERIRKRTAGYRTESDVVAEFTRLCCDRDPAATSSTAILYPVYQKFCADFGSPLQRHRFGRELGRLGFKNKKFANGNAWRGLRLKEAVGAD